MAKQIVVTESSFLKLKAELEYLKNVKRKEAAENVGIARSFGDLSENSEYDEAKNEQAKIEVQISELEETIAHARVISDHEIQTDVVNVGVTVTIFDMDYDEEMQYTLVSSREVDPLPRGKGCMHSSFRPHPSPDALMGKRGPSRECRFPKT